MNLKCFITAPSSGTQPPITPSSRDPCSPNPCSNGGTCNNNSNPYTCSCMFGYSGDNCDINSYEGKNFGVNMHSKKLPIIYSIYIYHINCGVIQGFPALRKVATTREKISYFFTCVDMANQLLSRHSPLAPLGQVDESTAKPSRFSIQVVFRSFPELWRLKH